MPAITARLLSVRRTGALCLTLCLICLYPGLLRSENLTMTTYYPAPYGGYVSILTTGKTVLARDAEGNVGIGTSNPASKLDVSGSAKVTEDIVAGRNISATGIVSGSDVKVGANSVVTTVICGAGLVCSVAGNSLTINKAVESSCTGCSAVPPACGKTTYGKDSCGKACSLTGPACDCKPNGSCNAPAPRCGERTFGQDNCGNTCSATGDPCCVPDGSCSAAKPDCDKITTGSDNCGTFCQIKGVKCSCWGNCSPDECYQASVTCQRGCGPVTLGNFVRRGVCMTGCNLRYPQCPRF